MAAMVRDIVTQVSSMPDADKLQLVDLLLRQLDKPDPEIDRVWAKEARKGERRGQANYVVHAARGEATGTAKPCKFRKHTI